MTNRTRGARTGHILRALLVGGAVFAAGCDDGKVATFGPFDTGVGGQVTPPLGGDGVGGQVVGGTGGDTPVGGDPVGGDPVGGTGGTGGGTGGEGPGGTGGVGGAVPGGGGAGGEPMGGAGGEGPPPDGELPDFSQVAATTSGDTTYVFWADGVGLQLRSFGSDFTWSGPATSIAEIAPAGVTVAAFSVSELPLLLWSTGDDQPIQVLNALDPASPPIALEVTGRPLLAQIQGLLLVAGRAPGADPERPVAWQLIDPLTSEVYPLQTFDGPNVVADSAGSLSDAAVLRFGSTGQCLFIDLSGAAIGNFLCRDGDAAFINSDATAGLILFARERGGDRVHQVVPLLGGGAQTPFIIGNEVGETVAYPFQGDNGVRPVVVRSRGAADDGRIAAFFAEPGQLFKGELFEDWPDQGTRALIRRGEVAVHVRFGYPDAPRLSTEALEPRPFGGNAYNFETPEGVSPDCTPTLEDCSPADLDCDDVPANGLCCGMDALRWRRNFTPPGPVARFAFGEAPNRDVYFMIIQTEAGALVPYFIDFTDRDGNVSEENGFMTDMQAAPRANEPPYDLTGAHDLMGYVNVSSWRATLARNVENTIGIFWNAPSAGAVSMNTRTFSPLDGCSEVLAFDRVIGDPAEHGQIAAIAVCRDAIYRVPPRLDDGMTEVIALAAPGGIPVRAEWATLTRFNAEIIILIVAYQTEAGELAFLRYQIAPLAQAGAPSGISFQPVGGGALASIDAEDRAWPVYWSVPNTAYVQLTAVAQARARVPDGQGWYWSNIVASPTVERFEFADLNGQLVGGGELPDGSGFGFWTLSLGLEGGTNLWAATPAVTLPGVHGALWHTTRGPSNNDTPGVFNGKLYPGIMALYADPANAGQWTVDISGARCLDP